MSLKKILEQFDVYTDDNSEISDADKLELAQTIYDQVINDRDWLFLRKTATGTLSTSVPYVSLPADWRMMAFNSDNEAKVYVGTNYKEYKVISFDERIDYRDQDGFCYIDVVNQRLYFTKQPTLAETYQFDYTCIPTALSYDFNDPAALTNVDPIFRDGFHMVIVHGMAADEHILEESEKARSYREENLQKYMLIFNQMRQEDARLRLNR